MSTQLIRFNGINRNVNQSDANIGDCEEMINVRSEGGILKIEKDKKQISLRNILYKRIITHQLSDTTNYIGFDDKGIVWFDPETGNIIKRLYDSEDNHDNIAINTINNMLIVSDSNIINNVVLLFKDNSYSIFIDKDGLKIPIYINHLIWSYDLTIGGNDYMNPFFYYQCTLDSSEDENRKSLQATINRFLKEHPDYIMGYYLVGMNFTLWDNTETEIQNLQAFYPLNAPQNKSFLLEKDLPLIETTANNYYLDMSDFLHIHWVNIGIPDDQRKTEYAEYIKSVNIYMSNPISSIRFEDNYISISSKKYNTLFIKDADLANELMYKVDSIDIKNILNDEGIRTVTLKPGNNEIVTNKTLDIASSNRTRAGKIKIYNNRAHFYNCITKLDLSQGYSVKSLDKAGDLAANTDYEANMYIYIRNNDAKEIVLQYPNIPLKSYNTSEPYASLLDYMIIIQDSRAYKIVFTHNNTYAEVELLPSLRYNYAYAYLAKLEFQEGNKYADIHPNDTYPEYNAINVTAQNNPIFFPVEHSYMFDGAVKDIAYATESITESQVGQYPFYIFTDRGIYSLEQGTGTVLYSNKILINTDRILKPSSTCITRNGVAYIANNSVYILSGRHNLNISLDLKGPIDTDIRQNQSYDLCCANIKLYDISQYLSGDTFDKYLDNAHLCYSSIADDLYVSNPDYPYSYVFSFIHKKWHKISESYTNINSTLIQRIVNITESTMIAATGSIDINSIIIKPEHTFNASYKFSITTDYKSGANERFALIINGDEVATTSSKYATELHMIIANLCKDIDYLDEYYDGLTHNIYSTGSVNFKVVNLYTNRTIIDTDIDTPCNSVTIPDKGVNSMIGLQSCNYNSDAVLCFEEFTRSITATDTTESIINILHDLILANKAYGFSASIENGTIQLTANNEGERGNKIVTSYNSNDYIDIHIEQLSGGKGDLPGQYGQILDMSKPIDCERDIHIQSRPISWPNAYTQINRFILNCRAKLSEKHNLSVYIYASNDLIEWKLVQACQKSNVNIDHIRLNRAAKAWKHYIVIIGGKVYSNTELSAISLDINTKYDNKLR